MVNYIKNYSFAVYFMAFMAVITGQALAQSDKVVIGIGEVRSSVRGANTDSFQTMLETQLIKTNKFKIIERSRLVEIFKEQGIGVAGLTDGADEFGGIEGVDYLVYGSITKLGNSKSGSSFAGIGSGKSQYEMAMDIRIVDVTTGEIRLAETVEKSIKAGSSFKIAGFGNTEAEGDPLADVQRLTAKQIVGAIATTIYPAQIIAIQKDGTHILNYGDAIYDNGDLMKVFEVGEGFVDPDTGETLGAEETEIGMLEVVSVTSKFSKARLVKGDAVEKGNIVRKYSDAELKAAKKAAKKAKKKRRKKL